MDVFYKQMGEEHEIRNLGQVFLYGEILYLRDKRGDDMGEINLSKCDDFTIVDNEPETEEENETEPKHAHWVEHFPFIDCSHCGKSVDIEYGGYWENADEHIFPKYCGYCGAKMDEGE